MTRRWIAAGLAVGLLGAGAIGFMARTDSPLRDDATMTAVVDPSRTLQLRVGIAERRLYVEVNGVAVDTMLVTVGTDRHPTPTGSFHIGRIIWNPSWHPPESEWARNEVATPPGHPRNPMGRVKMFFREPDYYLHGTNNERTIGYRGSHGCIRMRNEDVVEVARLAMLHGGEPREPNWFQRVLNRIRSTQDVRLSNPIPFVVEQGTPPVPIGEPLTT
ncbi:MAG TPA: L,D-transpeptidase family protein [Longimicrobiales bacterium]|nr:L,D-transpeptidase family protein [Longimicrobiales bacterium]